MATSLQLSFIKLALFVFIVVMGIVGYSMYKQVYKSSWQPVVGNCPDYWADVNGDGSKCVNTHALGTCNLPTKLYNLFSGKNSIGNNLTDFSNISLNTCQASCLNNAKCSGLAYKADTNHCTLKTNDVVSAEQQTDASYDLYIKNDTGIANSMNFNQYPFTGTSGTCSKYNWAKSCQTTWDGITSGIPNPCASSTK